MENNKSWWKQWAQQRFRWPLLVLLLLAFLIGYLIRGGSGGQINHMSPEAAGETSADQASVQIWTCSMHPQIRKPEPGTCPICGMDLVPVANTSEEQLGPRQLKLSPWAVKLAEIDAAPVQRRRLSAKMRLAGKVAYDETRLKYISARVPGRIDRLFVDYTGSAVGKGDPLVKLYSPELIVAQQELLQARQTLNRLNKRTLAAAREKLRLWGLSGRQIQEIERRKNPAQHLTIFSPIAGAVIHKNAVEGLYVQTGTRIYTIADLSRVWLKLDAYESDLSWLGMGQTVEFETEAYPGEVFRGKVAFIDPVLNPQTRTVKVRVNVPNPHNKLKPEMLARAKLHALSVDMQKDAPLVIPATAPLLTGKRAVVYVAVPGKEGVFEGREVVLGPRAGDYYEVKEGLAEGEMVVVNGAFKIDSDLQIRAKPSMMNPEGGGPAPEHHHHQGQIPTQSDKHTGQPSHSQQKIPAAFSVSIDSLTSEYLAMQQALSRDDLRKTREGIHRLKEFLALVDMKLLSDQIHLEWMQHQEVLQRTVKKMEQSRDIETLRRHFADLSASMTEVVKRFGGKIKNSLYRFHCPMALDNKGAYWLQGHPDTRNPYFGASMLKCQDLKEKLVPPRTKE